MNLEEAKAKLDKCTRTELRDHAFGDTEVTWFGPFNDFVADGYFGGGSASVTILLGENETSSFEGDEARELRKCGTAGKVERNDETGPDNYQEGVTMPGLTLEGVRQELEGS